MLRFGTGLLGWLPSFDERKDDNLQQVRARAAARRLARFDPKDDGSPNSLHTDDSDAMRLEPKNGGKPLR